MRVIFLKYTYFLLLFLLLSISSCRSKKHSSSDEFAILVDQKAPATVQLAATELQQYLQKITKQKFAIISQKNKPNQKIIFVGESKYTKQLGIFPDKLNQDSYIIKSGENWLALIGSDQKFQPIQPYSLARSQVEEVNKKWQRISRTDTNSPLAEMFKAYNKELDIWESDQRGTLNAVYGFLKSLGVRWYMPGEMGEVLPKSKKFVLPKVDKIVTPDFDLRSHYFYAQRFFQTDKEHLLWFFRLGLNKGEKYLGKGEPGHGINNILATDNVKHNHPEYFAIYNGKRDNQGPGIGKACLSSEGLKQLNIKYARAVYDIYKEDAVSVMPGDAYTKVCECNRCKRKIKSELGSQGELSDYVWNYVNDVAKELYKTHPNKTITCFAYGSYLLPPSSIKKLSPNIRVGICKWRSNYYDNKKLKFFKNLEKQWREISSQKLISYDYYLHPRRNGPHENIPAFFPNQIQEDLRTLQHYSVGDFIEIYRSFDGGKVALDDLTFNHLNIFLTASLYWNVNQEVDELLQEYYKNFYGNAAKEMESFFNHCAENWPTIQKNDRAIEMAFALLKKAKSKKLQPIFKQRINFIEDYIKPLRQIKNKLRLIQDEQRIVRAIQVHEPIFIDGKIQERIWNDLFAFPMYYPPKTPSNFPNSTTQFCWKNKQFILGINNKETDQKRLKKKYPKGNKIPSDDHVHILLETLNNKTYELVVSPEGEFHVVSNGDNDWAKGIEVASHRGKDFWSLEIKIPVGTGSPITKTKNFGLAGREPTNTYPWFFNIYRTRFVNGKPITTAFARATNEKSLKENRSKITFR